MWPLVLLAFSIAATLAYFARGRSGGLAKLALISWGATIMFAVDAAFAWLEGEEPIEVSVDAALLSATLIAVTTALWLVSLAFTKR